jgi:hypothetical protein
MLALLFIGCANFVASPFPNFHLVYGANAGREIDLFSQHGGIGENVSSPPFDAGELIILFAYVTYNQAPVQGIFVSFQVNNPQGTLILVSSATTNCSGYANISFRIARQMCPSPRSLWEAFATASIAQKTVLDTMPFYVLCSAPIIVPEDYQTIQAAINGASAGDTIFVEAGTYSSIVINRSVTLEGENKYTTVIEGSTEYHATESGMAVVANNVSISNFTIQNATGPLIRICGDLGVRLANITISDIIMMDSGEAIGLINTTGDVITNNIIKEGVGGIGFEWANDTIVQNNTIALCQKAILGSYPSYNNLFLQNNFINNNEAIQTSNVFIGNKFFHNNFINNTIQADLNGPSKENNSWDNGYPSGGNYWSDYTGADTHAGPHQNIPGSDGIGDTPYTINANNTDRYPLMSPYSTLSLSVANLPASVALDLCQAQTFNSSASGETLPYKYQWYLDSIAISGANDTSWTFAPSSAGSYAICLKVTDAANVTATSNIAAVTVNSALSVSVSPSSVALDVGQSKTFTATASGGSGTYSSYEWYVDGQPQSDQTSKFAYSSSAGSQGAYSITATVTDSLGVTSPHSSSATITVNPALVAPAVKSSPDIVDQRQTSVLSNTSMVTSGTSPYSYQWFEIAPGGSYIAVGSGLSFSFVTSNATVTGNWSFILQVTDSAGEAVNSSTVSVLVNAALVALNVMSSASTTDQGQTSILNSSSVTTGTSPYTYQWFDMTPGASTYSVIDGAILASYSFVTSGSTTTGVWYFELDVTDATGATATSNAVAVTVNTVPSVSVSPSSATLDVGQSLLFTSSVTGGTSPYSYQWYLNGVSVYGATGSSWTFTSTSSGSYTVYMNVTDIVGAGVKSSIATVTVNPTLSATISPSSATLDVNQSQTFTSTVSGGTSSYSYQWYLNGVAVSGAVSSSWTFTLSSSGSYTVYVKITDSATTPVAATSNIASVTVNSALAISILPKTVVMDVGQSQLFNSSVVGGTSPYSYQWYVDNSPVSGATSASWTCTQSSPGSRNVYVEVTDAVSAVATSNTISVNVNTELSLSITPTSSTLDLGESQLFNSTVSSGTSPYYYQWYLGSAAVSGATSPSWAFASPSTGSYTVYMMVTDAVGATARSNTANLTLNSAPSVSISPTAVILDVGQSQVFTSSVSGGTSLYSYQWYLNGIAVAGATSATWNFSEPVGSYSVYVKVTDSVSVTVTSNTASVTVNGVHDVAVTSVTPSKGAIVEVVRGHSINVSITVWNEGGYTETFNVTLYGEMLWGWENDTFPLYVFTGVTLTPGSTTTLTVSINLPAFPWGTYGLKACAGPVPGQTLVSDLVCTGGYVRVFSPKTHVWWSYGRYGLSGFVPI